MSGSAVNTLFGCASNCHFVSLNSVALPGILKVAAIFFLASYLPTESPAVKSIPTLLLILFSLCPTGTATAQTYHNLLAGDRLDQWSKVNGDPVGDGWKIEDGGVLHLSGKGGNIVTREKYGDFELWFEFRISEKGNSGIKYRVKPYGKRWLGLEYQILDDAAYPKLTRSHLTASLYDLVTPIPQTTRLKPDGEFNVGKIRVKNQRVQHWVNGQLMIDQCLTGPDWREHVAKSKFNNQPEFGENVLGQIMLTDHNSDVWLRNVFVRRLDYRN
ncbi:hypothetical protein Fuma_03855 [Fuerstiella marisgermanici]|uniref:3-keto-alpha-glucoside-1,2-lyase/3-keto-2-hydroxy-glucal hydratase domain-containing protein n=1 Tax=Fuerstiella marisgermanici TaxID=1891926 RepID=A0A1P8WJJ8_9PLAN|nr:hypothetical protein Fuma_03855 [Fuerstiella marisgermanici]